MAQSRSSHASLRQSRGRITDIADGAARDASPEGPFVIKAHSSHAVHAAHAAQGSLSPGGSSVSSASNGSMVFTIRSSSSGRDKQPSILLTPGQHSNRSPSKNAPAKLNRSSFSGKVGPERGNSNRSHDTAEDVHAMTMESKRDDHKEEEVVSGKKSRSRKKNAHNASSGWFSSLPALKDPRAINLVKRLFLTPAHLRKFRAKFEAVDIDGSGSIDIDEFFDMIKEKRSPLTDALFALIDCDSTSSIDFDEFVRVVCTYSMFTKEEILRFCFRYFDTDDSGSIDEKEYMTLARTVNNAAPMFPANFQSALQQFDVNDDGLIDFQEFMEIDRRFPLIMFPAYRLQDRMQKETLGERGWLKIIETVNRQRKMVEYMATHNGQKPPMSFLESCCPCFGATAIVHAGEA